MLLKLKVLLIDDDKEFLTTLKDYLEERNCQVFTAACQQEALKITKVRKNQKLPVDVAIIDYIMPDCDGIDTSHKLVSIDSAIFTVALTEHDNTESIRALVQQGDFRQVISKFDDEEKIERMIDAARTTKRQARKAGNI